MLAVAVGAGLARALSLEVDLEGFEGAGVAGGRSRLLFGQGPDGEQGSLLLRSLELAPGLTLTRLEFTCQSLEVTASEVACERATAVLEHPATGPLRSAASARYGRSSGELAVRLQGLPVAGGAVDLNLDLGPQGLRRARVRASGLQAGALHALLAPLAPGAGAYAEVFGSLDLDLALGLEGRSVAVERLRLQARGLAFSGPQLAQGAELAAEARGRWSGRALALEGQVVLSQGAVYLEPGPSLDGVPLGLTLEVTGDPVSLDYRLGWQPREGRLALEHARLVQPGVLTASAVAELSSRDGLRAERLQVELEQLELAAFNAAYLKPLCASVAALCGLEMEGSVAGRLELRGAAVEALELQLREVYLDDRRRRFRAAGLAGTLVFDRGPRARGSGLRWQALGLYRLDFGAGRVDLQSSGGELRVVRWADLPFLGGALKLTQLRLGGLGSEAFTVVTEGELTPVPMADFCAAMGWPPMSGVLSGVFPRMVYRDGLLVIEGDVVVRVFDGAVTVSELRVENLFGPRPELTTQVKVEDLDLLQLTDTFAFGSIEGRLEGRIADVRLVDWSPVSFDARLESPPGDDSRHRISRRAVDNLGAIGSGGAGGALQGGLMGFIEEYSYGRLGLACRLEDGVCELDGVERTAEGFLIVTRGGLLPPWVEVKGTGRRVPWSSLLYGIKRMSEGGAEVE